MQHKLSNLETLLTCSMLINVIDVPYIDIDFFISYHLYTEVLGKSAFLKDYNLIYVNPVFGVRKVKVDKFNNLTYEEIDHTTFGLTREEANWLTPMADPACFPFYLSAIAKAGIAESSDAGYKQSIFVIQGLQKYLPENEAPNSYIELLLVKLGHALTKTAKKVILIDPDITVPKRFSQFMQSVEYEYQPKEWILSRFMQIVANEQQHYINKLKTNAVRKSGVSLAVLEESVRKGSKEELEAYIKATSGLSYSYSRLLLLEILKEHSGVLTSEGLKSAEAKRIQVLKDLGIEVMQTNQAICGMDRLQKWLERRKGLFLNENNILPKPKGILLVGRPGEGKSLAAKNVARTWRIPALNINFGQLKHENVGRSEANLTKVLKAAASASPCVLLIDEIEKAGFGKSGQKDSSGVSQSMLGIFLTWMQDHTESVFIVATCNDATLLPDALLRKGRFDEIFRVDNPNWKERIEIIRSHLAFRGVKNSATLAGVEKFAVSQVDRFSGAEITSVVDEAVLNAVEDGRYPTLRIQDLEAARLEIPQIQADRLTSKYLEVLERLGVPVSSPVENYPSEYIGDHLGITPLEIQATPKAKTPKLSQ